MVADEKRLPLKDKLPKRTTRRALAELNAEKGKGFATVHELMADLNAGD